jgi:hypothetical protein
MKSTAWHHAKHQAQQVSSGRCYCLLYGHCMMQQGWGQEDTNSLSNDQSNGYASTLCCHNTALHWVKLDSR